MKKLLITLTILVLIVGVLAIPTKQTLSQVGQSTIISTVWRILQEGILYPEPDFGYVWLDEYTDMIDTSSTMGTNSYNTFNIGTVAGSIALDTSGTLWKTTYTRKGNGILRLSSIGDEGINGGMRNIQKNAGILTDSTSTGHWKQIKYRIALALNDSTNIGVVAGLMSPDADSLRNYGVAYGVMLEKPYGSNAWNIRSKNQASHATRVIGGATANGNIALFEIGFDWLDTNLVYPVVNGRRDSALTTYLPKQKIFLQPSVEVSGADTITIDYQKVFIER